MAKAFTVAVSRRLQKYALVGGVYVCIELGAVVDAWYYHIVVNHGVITLW